MEVAFFNLRSDDHVYEAYMKWHFCHITILKAISKPFPVDGLYRPIC